MEGYKTGGGTFIKKTSVLDEKTISLTPSRYVSLENNFDSNNVEVSGNYKVLAICEDLCTSTANVQPNIQQVNTTVAKEVRKSFTFGSSLVDM